jgi:hypothetical protein
VWWCSGFCCGLCCLTWPPTPSPPEKWLSFVIPVTSHIRIETKFSLILLGDQARHAYYDKISIQMELNSASLETTAEQDNVLSMSHNQMIPMYVGGRSLCYNAVINNLLFLMAQQPCCGTRPPPFWGSESTVRHTTLGRTPLDKRSARRRDLYLITHNTHDRQTSMLPVRFEPAIPAKRAAANSRLRPYGLRDRQQLHLVELQCRRSRWPFAWWDCGFEFRRRHGCLLLVNVVRCQ